MTREAKISLRRLAVCVAFVFLSQPATGQDSKSTEDGSQSGYDDIAEFGGPESVGTRLKENDEKRRSDYRFDGLQHSLGSYFDWKRRVKEDHDVSFGTSLYLLYQKASDSLPGQDDDALGHIFRYQGSWSLFHHANRNSGRIAWRVESRSHVGGFQALGSLGGATGILDKTGHIPLDGDDVCFEMATCRDGQ